MDGQEVVALTMARNTAFWRFKKALRFRERVRRRHVVRKSGNCVKICLFKITTDKAINDRYNDLLLWIRAMI